MFPVRIMLMYWSAVARLRNSPEPTVDATTLTVLFMNRTNTDVMLPSMPLAVIAPPKHMAQSISQMVFIIPAMPRVATNELSVSMPVSKEVGPYQTWNRPLNWEDAEIVSAPAIWHIKSGWKNKANNPAMVDDKNNVMMGDIRLAIKTPVKTGTANNQTDIWNVPFKDSAKAAMDSESALSCKNPATAKISKVIRIDGTVVISI